MYIAMQRKMFVLLVYYVYTLHATISTPIIVHMVLGTIIATFFCALENANTCDLLVSTQRTVHSKNKMQTYSDESSLSCIVKKKHKSINVLGLFLGQWLMLLRQHVGTQCKISWSKPE